MQQEMQKKCNLGEQHNELAHCASFAILCSLVQWNAAAVQSALARLCKFTVQWNTAVHLPGARHHPSLPHVSVFAELPSSCVHPANCPTCAHQLCSTNICARFILCAFCASMIWKCLDQIVSETNSAKGKKRIKLTRIYTTWQDRTNIGKGSTHQHNLRQRTVFIILAMFASKWKTTNNSDETSTSQSLPNPTRRYRSRQSRS